jgi:CRP/FNR family transcriptional regulator, anaerobic regulatory protein
MKATDHFLQFVHNISNINKEETELLRNIIKEEHLPKRHIILQEGQYCKDYFFLYSGVVWVNKLLKDEIKTINIFGANSLITDLYSIKRNVPSLYTFQTLRPSVLLRIKSSDFLNLCQLSSNFDRMMRIIYEETLIHVMDRLHEILFYDATQRYQNFFKSKTELIKQVPQKYIASYLDVTPETLSRIRGGEIKSEKAG